MEHSGFRMRPKRPFGPGKTLKTSLPILTVGRPTRRLIPNSLLVVLFQIPATFGVLLGQFSKITSPVCVLGKLKTLPNNLVVSWENETTDHIGVDRNAVHNAKRAKLPTEFVCGIK